MKESDKISLKFRGGIIYIVLEDEIIGKIDCTYETLENMQIDKEYRDNGYGTEALSQYVNLAKENNFRYIRTTPVLSEAMETILRKQGFEPCEDNNTEFELHI